MNQSYKSFVFLTAFIFAAFLPAALHAAGQWVEYVSPTGLYKVRMPEEYKVTKTQFMINNNRAVNSEETSAVIDLRPYKDSIKSYIVKLDQTIGPALTKDEINRALENELNKYIQNYESLGGVVVEKTNTGFNEMPGGGLIMTYNDPKLGTQTLQARILFTPSNRLEQIFIGPEDLMKSFQTKDFFESLEFKNGVSYVRKAMKEDWSLMESPTGMFTVLYPGAKSPPYYTTDPVTQWDDTKEIVSMVFTDPIRDEKIFFNVYGYRFENDIDYGIAQKTIESRHITRMGGSLQQVEFSSGSLSDDKVAYISTSYGIKALAGFPFLQSAKLRAYFAGKNMIVAEILTSKTLYKSALSDNLLQGVIFTPDKMHPPVKPVLKNETIEAPADKSPAPASPAPETEPAGTSAPAQLEPAAKPADTGASATP